MKKKIISIITIFIILFGSINSYATENNLEEKIDFITNLGYPRLAIETMEPSYINELYNEAYKNPNTLNISWGVMEIDNIEQIQLAVNLDDTELKSIGYSEQDIKKIRSTIDKINDTINKSSNKNFSNMEKKLLKKALKKNDSFKRKIINEKATLTSEISTTKFILSQSISSLSTNNPDYEVYISWQWKDPYFWDVWEDKIVVAWGGDFNHDRSYYRDYAYSNYYNIFGIWPAFSWASYSEKDNHSVKEIASNGIEWSNDQSNSIDRMRYGYQRFRIYKNNTAGEDTMVTSQYLHRTLSAGDFSISLSGPSINAGSSWDYSEQGVNTIEY